MVRARLANMARFPDGPGPRRSGDGARMVLGGPDEIGRHPPPVNARGTRRLPSGYTDLACRLPAARAYTSRPSEVFPMTFSRLAAGLIAATSLCMPACM